MTGKTKLAPGRKVLWRSGNAQLTRITTRRGDVFAEVTLQDAAIFCATQSDGLKVFKAISTCSQTPLIFLGGRGE